MRLDNQMLALIAVGASVTANCQPCLGHNVRLTLECGSDGQQIAAAIDIGKRVREGAASKLDKFTSSLDLASRSSTLAVAGGCECGS